MNIHIQLLCILDIILKGESEEGALSSLKFLANIILLKTG